MDTSFLFDEFFVTSSVYTVDFIAPLDHSSLIVDLIQLSKPFTSLVLLQKDYKTGFVFTFVSALSVGEFHTELFTIVNKIRSLHKLTYSQFRYV